MASSNIMGMYHDIEGAINRLSTSAMRLRNRELINECRSISHSFYLSVTPIIAEFDDSNHKQDLVVAFSKAVMESDILARIAVAKEMSCDKDLILPKIPGITGLMRNISIDDDRCSCGGEFNNYVAGEYCCDLCGHIKERLEESVNFAESECVKKSGFDYAKHCDTWLQRIQALERVHIPSDIILTIRRCMKDEGVINVTTVSCEAIRRYLREAKLGSKWNDYIPLIRSHITEVSPPEFTTEEHRMILNDFIRIAAKYDEIKPNGKSNKIYYPYIIRKILERRFANDGRRLHLWLEQIHMQKMPTVVSNDNTFEVICRELEDYGTCAPTIDVV
jgi:hypothetical protein